MRPLRAGDLRHRIEIRRPVQTDDGKGGYVTEWQDIGKPWAEVIGLQGRESVMNHALQGVAVYRIRIRHRRGIDTGDQVRFGAIELNIRSCADPFGTRRELVIIADTANALAA